MFGTVLNVGTIILGGVIGLTVGKHFSEKIEYRIKLILGIVTIWLGMKTIWQSLNGTFGQVLKQIAIILTALVIGNLIGKLLGLQKQLNKLGEYAKKMFQEQDADKPRSFGEGFVTCTILFCVGPMAILGAVEDGLSGKFQILAIKSAMDGLATMAFVKPFGVGPIFAAIPVLAYQGTLTLGAASIKPFLQDEALMNSINGSGGLLILCIAVVLLDIQKVPLADYLPTLIVAPALTWILT